MKYWIIGASSGIGKSIAIELDKIGCDMILSSSNSDKLIKASSKLQKNHLLLPFNLSNKDECIRNSEIVINKNMSSLCIIYMAAAYSPNDYTDYEKIIDTNITGLLHVLSITKEYLKNTHEQSKLIICSSLVAYKGLPYSQPYSLTKAALLNLASSLSIELRNVVDVKVITPGFVKTQLTDKNTFPMPFIMSSEKAAKIIINGINSKKYEITFPLPMYIIMKCFQILPNFIGNYIGSVIKKTRG